MAVLLDGTSEPPQPLLASPAPRVVVAAHLAGIRPPQDQPGTAVGVGCREQERHRPTLREAQGDGAFRPHIVEHRADVVHPDFERRRCVHRDGIGQPGPALVEQDQATRRCQAAQEHGQVRLFPVEFDVREEPRHEHEIHRPLARGLVGDVDRAAAGVADRRGGLLEARAARGRIPSPGPTRGRGSPAQDLQVHRLGLGGRIQSEFLGQQPSQVVVGAGGLGPVSLRQFHLHAQAVHGFSQRVELERGDHARTRRSELQPGQLGTSRRLQRITVQPHEFSTSVVQPRRLLVGEQGTLHDLQHGCRGGDDGIVVTVASVLAQGSGGRSRSTHVNQLGRSDQLPGPADAADGRLDPGERPGPLAAARPGLTGRAPTPVPRSAPPDPFPQHVAHHRMLGQPQRGKHDPALSPRQRGRRGRPLGADDMHGPGQLDAHPHLRSRHERRTGAGDRHPSGSWGPGRPPLVVCPANRA